MKLKLVSIAALVAGAACAQEKKAEAADAPPPAQQAGFNAPATDVPMADPAAAAGAGQGYAAAPGYAQVAMQQNFPDQGYGQQPGMQQQQQFPANGGQAQQNFPQGQGYPPQPGAGQQGFPQQQDFPPQGQGYPPQGQGYPPQQEQFPQPQPQPQPQPAPGGQGANLDQLMQMEKQDFGVPATKELYSGQMHAPTPASIPGGQLITTKGLVALVQGKQAPYLLFDVLGGQETLPGALAAVPASQPGGFTDQTQQQFGGFLQQMTQGKKDTPLVFYCLSTQCWMSYNAALRAINMGYTNVLWYRGGIEAWKQAGLPVQSVTQAPFQQPMPQQPQQQQGYPNQQ